MAISNIDKTKQQQEIARTEKEKDKVRSQAIARLYKNKKQIDNSGLKKR